MPYPADLYAAVHDGTPGDVEFYRAQCRDAASVLELGCGFGRILTALAPDGLELVGLDVDAAQLERARRAIGDLPATARDRVELREADMRTFDLGRRFDRILIPHTGLYCLLSDDDVVQCFESVRRHLADGGRFVFDAYYADAFHRSARPGDVAAQTLVPVKTVHVRGIAWKVLERSTWDPSAQRIEATYVHVPDEGEPVEGTIVQRYLLTEQLGSLLEQAGLRLERLRDGFGTESVTDESTVWSAIAVAT